VPEASCGIVLAGASALGAYEAGLVDYVSRVVAPELGRAGGRQAGRSRCETRVRAPGDL